MILKEELVTHLFWILLVSVYSLRQLEITFNVHHDFKVSPSATCFSTASAVCMSIGIFNKTVFYSLTLASFESKYSSLFLYQLLVFVIFDCVFILVHACKWLLSFWRVH
jgi:hypothetical protein